MQVIIMRHGESCFKDGCKTLSDKGTAETKTVGLKILSKVSSVDRAISSTLLRARDTLNTLLSLPHMPDREECEELSDLSPGGDPFAVVEYVKAVSREEDTVVLVSHMPDVIRLSFAFCNKEFDVPMFGTSCALLLKTDKDGNFEPAVFYTPCSEKSFTR